MFFLKNNGFYNKGGQMRYSFLITILLTHLYSVTLMASTSYEFKSEFAYKDGSGSLTLYDVYCGHTASKDFCAIETLYITKTKKGCEISPTSWSYGDRFYAVTFDPSDKSFMIKNNRKAAKNKLEFVITKKRLKSFDGDFNMTDLPKTKKISLSCKDVTFKTHLRGMVINLKSPDMKKN